MSPVHKVVIVCFCLLLVQGCKVDTWVSHKPYSVCGEHKDLPVYYQGEVCEGDKILWTEVCGRKRSSYDPKQIDTYLGYCGVPPTTNPATPMTIRNTAVRLSPDCLPANSQSNNVGCQISALVISQNDICGAGPYLPVLYQGVLCAGDMYIRWDTLPCYKRNGDSRDTHSDTYLGWCGHAPYAAPAAPVTIFDSGVQLSAQCPGRGTAWMRAMEDSTPLSHLFLPGTHESMALYGGGIEYMSVCQDNDLNTQLRDGIRSVDIRPSNMKDLPIYHGLTYQKAYFKDVLDVVRKFLNDNPWETLVMRIGMEGGSYYTNYWSEVLNRMQNNFGFYVWDWAEMRVPTLNEVRGKIVLLNHNLELEATNNSILTIQNNYSWHGADKAKSNKWNVIRSMLDAQNTPSTWWYNFISAADAHWRSDWPDAYAKYENPLVEQYILSQYNANQPLYGVLALDFYAYKPNTVPTMIRFNARQVGVGVAPEASPFFLMAFSPFSTHHPYLYFVSFCLTLFLAGFVSMYAYQRFLKNKCGEYAQIPEIGESLSL